MQRRTHAHTHTHTPSRACRDVSDTSAEALLSLQCTLHSPTRRPTALGRTRLAAKKRARRRSPMPAASLHESRQRDRDTRERMTQTGESERDRDKRQKDRDRDRDVDAGSAAPRTHRSPAYLQRLPKAHELPLSFPLRSARKIFVAEIVP